VRKYVFDASALLALLERTAGTAKVNELVKEAHHGRSQILMSSVNYGEVYGKVLRDHGQDQAIRSMGAVRRLPIELYDAGVQRALHAQDVKARYKLYYVDSFAAALAIENKAILVTSDSDFRKLGHNFSILWLKN
jgi:PIN domain nuclease of toxin-antitoxin system